MEGEQRAPIPKSGLTRSLRDTLSWLTSRKSSFISGGRSVEVISQYVEYSLCGNMDRTENRSTSYPRVSMSPRVRTRWLSWAHSWRI